MKQKIYTALANQLGKKGLHSDGLKTMNIIPKKEVYCSFLEPLGLDCFMLVGQRLNRPSYFQY